MAEPLLHKDSEYSKSVFFCECYTFPFANSAINQALLEACHEHPTDSPREANADLGADCAESAHPGVFFEVPNPPSTMDCARFVHPDAFFEVPKPYPQENCKEEHVQSIAAYAHKCEESAHLHEEFADSTEACGNDGDCTCARVGSADICNAMGTGVSCSEGSRGNIAKTHGDIRDACGVLAYPCVEVMEYSLPCLSSDPQPCVSECSSVTSMVTGTILESTSRSSDANMETKFAETQWTDAKHRSYLTLMEANFVKVLYSREYCALDVCGEAPCHPGSSSLPLPSSLLEFKSGHTGDWWTPEPPFPACIPSALLKSPWVNHFWHRNSARACHQIKDENTGTSIDMDEGEEEVDSPLTFISHAEEPQKGNEVNRRHWRIPRSKMGLQEKHMSNDGSNGGMIVGESKEDVLQEFAHATLNSTSFPNLKKRGFQSDCKQNPYTGHKREKS